MRLINQATGSTIPPGAILHVVSGPNMGQAWRYERIRPMEDGAHRVHVTKSHPKLGRVHREYHAHVFGAEVKIDITWQRHTLNSLHHVVSRMDEWIMAGFFALVPLSLFETLHLAEPITELFTLGRGR